MIFSKQKGFTLVSALVYIGLLALVSAMLARIAADFLRLNTQGQVYGEVIDNAQRSLEIITQEIQISRSVYTPTSVFNTSPGQLSLATTNNLPSDEKTTYVDFYVDDDRLYLKREGSSPQLLTSQRMRVENFTLTRITSSPSPTPAPTASPTPTPGTDAAAVRINLTLTYDSPSAALTTPVTVPVTTTVSLRAY